MKRQHVMNCSFSSWYSTFKDYTIRSRVLKIPANVLKYLNGDGIVLPESSQGINSRVGTEWDSDDEDLNDVWADEKSHTSKVPQFPEFDEEINKAVKALGGKVFPKLNWSSPKDASWIALNHSLECRTPADVYLLLKSSTFVAHDLTNPFQVCSESEVTEISEDSFEYELVLRRWHNLNPAGEFRCFVKNRALCGLCQRQHGNYFESILREKDRILQDISTFYKDVIQERFPDSDYVVDLYRNDEGKIYILDFNPFSSVTDGLMFTWQEIRDLDSENLAGNHGNSQTKVPEFRFVETEKGLQGNPYQQYAMPQDFVDLATGMDPNKLMDFLQLKIQQQGDESSSDDEAGTEAVKSISPNTSLGEPRVTREDCDEKQLHTPGNS